MGADHLPKARPVPPQKGHEGRFTPPTRHLEHRSVYRLLKKKHDKARWPFLRTVMTVLSLTGLVGMTNVLSPARASTLAVIGSEGNQKQGSFYFSANFPQTDNASGVLNAYNAASTAGGGIVVLPSGNSPIDLVNGMTWSDPKVQLWGTIGSVLTAGSLATSQVLNVTIPYGHPGGVFQSFVVDGSGTAGQ